MFYRHLGRSPKEEITRIKLERVKDLLTTTRLPSEEIARLAGFEFTESMHRLFRAVRPAAGGLSRNRRIQICDAAHLGGSGRYTCQMGRNPKESRVTDGRRRGPKAAVSGAQAGLVDGRRRLHLSSDWLFAAALFAAVFLAYQPVWHAAFIWDDDAHLTANPCVVGPKGLKEIWTTKAGRICPLVQTTFWVEHKLWGLAPLPYHLVNLLLHAANALVLWQVLRRLGVFGAGLGAAIWALHPVQVETAVWITEAEEHAVRVFLSACDPVFCQLRPGPMACPG